MNGPNNLQSQVDDLLTVPRTRPVRVFEAVLRARFTPFDPVQLLRAGELANQFAAVANSIEGEAGLNAAVDEARRATVREDPELVRYAFLLFVTHDPKGNQIRIKPLEKRAPEQVLPSASTAVPLRGIADGAAAPTDPEAALKWFREDPKANEHHEHWHLVYRANGDQTGQTRDRQGELFLYMHEQMLARYNAERFAVALDPVKPLPLSDDTDYSEQIPGEYNPDSNLSVIVNPQDPSQITHFSKRESGKQFGDLRLRGPQPGDISLFRVTDLKRWGDNLLQAARSGSFQDGTPVTADLLGATVEASIGSVDPITYGEHHNLGHIFLADINDPQNPDTTSGVMSQTRTAIRDPIFFRWHKHIDDISFLWQQQQPPNNFSDAPQVLIRKGLSGATLANQSPDIILCFKDVILPHGSGDSDAFWQAFGETNFGGANWDKDFSSGTTTTSQLQTAMRNRTITFTEDDNLTETISYLYPREFFYFLRVENPLAQAKDVTLRIFLVPTGSYSGIAEVADDRRMWIEMDKFKYTLQASQRAVIFRRAEASSVIRRPALKAFPPIQIPDTQPDTGDRTEPLCDCGWPYNLLLPQGTRAGMNFRLMVMVTDWDKDRVPDPEACGSMSFCGLRDRYPDSRAMGYPFDRPFSQGSSIGQTIAAQNNMVARNITIKLVDSVPG